MLDRPIELDAWSPAVQIDGVAGPSWETVDPLGEALHALRLDGAFYCRSEMTAPWGITLPAMPGCLWFHAVVTGSCQLDGEGLAPRTLVAGDFVLVPHGHGHRLRTAKRVSAPVVFDLPHAMVEERYALLRHGGGGEPTTLVCGVVKLEHPTAADLVHALPPAIQLHALSSPHAEWLQSTLRLMAVESRELLPGGETVVTRLCDILVIQAIRAWLEGDPDARTGWLGALRDPQIGRAITLIHREPARPFTVASLASEVAMSRSAFAERFAELVGEAPMRYVTRVRMRLAQSLLRDERPTIGELAARVGYQSEAAFSRAFKRFVGTPPGAAKA